MKKAINILFSLCLASSNGALASDVAKDVGASHDVAGNGLHLNIIERFEESRLLGKKKSSKKGSKKSSKKLTCPARNHKFKLVGEITSDQENGERIGLAVSISSDGSRMAVLKKLTDDRRASDGVVQVYDEVSPGVWEQVGNDLPILGCILEECDEFEGEGPVAQWGYFTRLISLSGNGNVLAIASPYYDWDDFYGRVDVYHWNDGSWENMMDEDFGIEQISFPLLSRMVVSLSHSGLKMAVGTDTSIYGTDTGSVAMYRYSKDKGWYSRYPRDVFEGDEDMTRGFGGEASISGNGKRVAVLFEEKEGSDVRSILRVYGWGKKQWKKIGNDIHFADGFLQGNILTSINHDGTIVAAGPRVFKLRKNKKKWYQLGNEIENLSNTDDWKVSLSRSGYRIALGNPIRQSNRGRVQIFDYKKGKWCKQGQILGRGKFEEFGRSLALSANGRRFVGGAPDPQGLTFTESYVEVYKIVKKK